MKFKVLCKEGKARRGVFETVHGTVQTPAFMNVATCAAIKGGLSAADLSDINCQVMLANTYHLSLRPGEDVIYDMGGIKSFTGCKLPVLTDSGGFQVFSLAKLRKITEEGVAFSSHIDGRRIFMSPEDSITIQSKIASTIAMAFDECVANPSTYEYTKQSCDRTVRWLERCIAQMKKLNMSEKTINRDQLLFGINQGSVFEDLRVDNMKKIARLDLDGYAIGGLAVGETTKEMYDTIDVVEPHMPTDKVRYLMGVGTCENIIEAVARGVDLFDCVMPSRNARHGHLCTFNGIINLNNQKYERDTSPIDENCDCFVCRNYSRAYVRHLLKAKELLGYRLAVMHNLYFYNNLMTMIRTAIENNEFEKLRSKYSGVLSRRI